MTAERKTSMQWKPATCTCVIEFGLYRDGVNYDTATADAETIIQQCDAHAAATTAAELEALIAPENEALAMAYGEILDHFNYEFNIRDNVGLVSWSINEAREVLITVRGANATLQAKLDAITNLVPTYE